MGAFGALRVWSPYVGAGGTAPGGAGNGGADRIAIWQDASVLTSSANLTYASNGLTAGPAGGAGTHQFNGFMRVSGTGTGQFIIQDTAPHTTTGAPRMSFTADSASLAVIGYEDPITEVFTFRGIGSVSSFRWVLANTITAMAIDQNGKVTIGAVGTSVVHNINTDTSTTVGAAGAGEALPAQPDGYIKLQINSVEKYIPIYAPG